MPCPACNPCDEETPPEMPMASSTTKMRRGTDGAACKTVVDAAPFNTRSKLMAIPHNKGLANYAVGDELTRS
jgi:hypothetical protein